MRASYERSSLFGQKKFCNIDFGFTCLAEKNKSGSVL